MSARIRDWLLTLIVVTLRLCIISSTGSDHSGVCRHGAGLFRHPSRCDAFIECTGDGHSVERYCGPTLYFNADKRVCDYQQLVNCHQLNDVPTKYEETRQTYQNEGKAKNYASEQSTSGGSKSYHETVYGQQALKNDQNGAPASSYASDLQSYCHRATEEAKVSTHQWLARESSLAGHQSAATGPYSYVSNFLHTQPYAKTLTYSAISSASAVKLIQERYGMSGNQVLKVLNELGMNNYMLKPLPGQYHADTEFPVAPDYDFCPYPANIACQQESHYRTIDGTCNNVEHPVLGRAMTPYRRLLPPNYADGVSAIRQSATGQSLPSARAVSHQLFTDIDRSDSSHTTLALVFYSQFLDHDLTRTAAYKVPAAGHGEQMKEVECGSDGCAVSDDPLDPCLPIAIPDDDYDFAANKCLKFVRSMPVPLLNCHLGPREQLNQVTHWIDGSQVYGSSKKESDAIRDLSQPDRGRMATKQHPNSYSKPLLPTDAEAAVCNGKNETIHCFKAGDGRVNENSGITSYHTVFIRQHNLLEEGLHFFNPSWNGDRLFQETRRIVIAMLQHVTYNELLPLIVGQQAVHDYQLNLLSEGYFDGYDSSVDSRIPNEFAAAAFRFGHTLLQERLHRINEHGQVDDSLWLSQTFNSPVHMYDQRAGGIDSFIRGLSREISQPFDWFFTKQITRSLFTAMPPTGVGHDLTAINIQRGRDHGIATYNDVREWCGLRRAHSFEDLSSEIDADFVQEIRRVYSHVDDIDLFVGGVSENPVKGAVVGPTFACVIASTFRNLRIADRFWYENKLAGFTSDQLQELRKTRLARILCLNSDSITEIQPYVFLQPAAPAYHGNEASQFNSPVPCDSLPDIDLSLWKESGY